MFRLLKLACEQVVWCVSGYDVRLAVKRSRVCAPTWLVPVAQWAKPLLIGHSAPTPFVLQPFHFTNDFEQVVHTCVSFTKLCGLVLAKGQ